MVQGYGRDISERLRGRGGPPGYMEDSREVKAGGRVRRCGRRPSHGLEHRSDGQLG